MSEENELIVGSVVEVKGLDGQWTVISEVDGFGDVQISHNKEPAILHRFHKNLRVIG